MRTQTRAKGHFPGSPAASSVFFPPCLSPSLSLCCWPPHLPRGGLPREATDNKSGVGGWQSRPLSRRPCSLEICPQTSPATVTGSQLGLGPKSWLISSVFVQRPLCSQPVESLGGHAAKMVEVPGTRILDFFFSKSDRTNNSLPFLANRYIDQSQIQTCSKLNQAM